MKLKEQLELLKGYDVKIGGGISFIYCEICDENIFNIIEKNSIDYHRDLIKIKNELLYEIENFDSIWKQYVNNKIKILKNKQTQKIENESNILLEKDKNEAKIKGKKLTKVDICLIKSEQEKLKKKYSKEFKSELITLKEELEIRKEKNI